MKEMPLTGEEQAYLGGLVDGEGTISVQPREGDGKYGYTPTPSISMGMSSGMEEGSEINRLLRELTDWVGSDASIRSHESWYPDNGTGERIYCGTSETWGLAGTPALKVIRVLSPHLRLKRHRAELILLIDWDVRSRKNTMKKLAVCKRVSQLNDRKENELDLQTAWKKLRPDICDGEWMFYNETGQRPRDALEVDW